MYRDRQKDRQRDRQVERQRTGVRYSIRLFSPEYSTSTSVRQQRDETVGITQSAALEL